MGDSTDVVYNVVNIFTSKAWHFPGPFGHCFKFKNERD